MANSFLLINTTNYLLLSGDGSKLILGGDGGLPATTPTPTPSPGGVGGRRRQRAEYLSTIRELKKRLAKEERQEAARQLEELAQYLEHEQDTASAAVAVLLDRLTDNIELYRVGQKQVGAVIKQIQELSRLIEQDEDDALSAVLIATLARR